MACRPLMWFLFGLHIAQYTINYFSMALDPFGTKLNDSTLENLHGALAKVTTSGNLLVLARPLSSLLNFLTPFLNLKTRGKFDKTIWLDTLLETSTDIVENYATIIFIIQDSDLAAFSLAWAQLNLLKIKVCVIVKDLSRSFFFELSTKVFRANRESLLTKISDSDIRSSVHRLSPTCRLINWQTHPVCVQDFVYTLDMAQGGLKLYFFNPIEQTSKLSDAVVDIMSQTTSSSNIFKLKNAFAKGDHSSLLLNVLQEEKIPEFVGSKLAPNEQDFYMNKLRGNVDLVVLERNLDYFPLFLSQLNYMGLLDDLFCIEDEYNEILTNKERVNDELYENLRHLNFSSIGVKLNQLARYIQLEYENSDKLKDLHEIKKLVSNLGSLTTKQELVKKHTGLSEAVMKKIRENKEGDEKYNLKEQWLALQNDLFDLEYRPQVARLRHLVNEYATFPIIASLAVLVSLINDGIKQKDLEALESDVHQNFGLELLLVFRKLVECKLIKVNARSNDFFGNFTFGKTEIETTTTSTASSTVAAKEAAEERTYDDISLLGVTGAQDAYKSTYTLINKFWNLHPAEDSATNAVEAVLDYAQPSFALSSGTVPLLARIVESLYLRDFLKYRPVISISKRPNWNNLNLDTMFRGHTIDRNLCDELDSRKSTAVTDSRQQYVIVVILGGITRLEISVLRHLQSKLPKKLMVVTSGIVNNRKLLQVLAA